MGIWLAILSSSGSLLSSPPGRTGRSNPSKTRGNKALGDLFAILPGKDRVIDAVTGFDKVGGGGIILGVLAASSASRRGAVGSTHDSSALRSAAGARACGCASSVSLCEITGKHTKRKREKKKKRDVWRVCVRVCRVTLSEEKRGTQEHAKGT